MIEFIKTKKMYVIALAVLFVFVSLSETTYSLFLKSDETEEFNYNTGLLDLAFTEDKKMILENTFPTIDSEGSLQTPYKLTIKNTGSLPYLFDLKMISDKNTNHIDYKYIKVKVNNLMPISLDTNNNTIISKLFLYPDEEITLNIRIWLDNSTPNDELGKSFSAKIVSSGTATYKTLDNSGANHPKLKDDMFPVYYDETNKIWRLADRSNTDISSAWYDYNNKKWANSITLKDSKKYIYDITRNNDLEINDIKVNNGNVLIDEKSLDIGLSDYNYDTISNILRIKLTDLTKDKVYIISNGNISYYYDVKSSKFIFKCGNNTVISDSYIIEKDKWYIVGYTYDESNVSFYVNGTKIGTSRITGRISSNKSFKLGTDNSFNEVSKITIGSVLIYYPILRDNEINKNYHTSMNIINDGLIAGYINFTPMDLKEYYSTLDEGSKVTISDISSFYVWIPRFKYKVWNATGKNDIDSYNAYNNGIDIIFEKSASKTGTILCNNTECFSDDLGTIKISEYDNNKYYTHPAFTNSTKELLGFWVSKYEISTNASNCNLNNINGCTTHELNIESKIDNGAWRNNNLSNYYKAILKLNPEQNYRIIKNTEWGAIAYLTHSQYGLCSNNNCTEIEGNKTYRSGSNPKDTTTANIYGVFDMAGGASEFTMSNYNNSALLNSVPVSNEDYDSYTVGTFILGDATKEITNEEGIWYGDTLNNTNETNNWIIRGGNNTENYKGIFAYGTINDVASEYITTRIVAR